MIRISQENRKTESEIVLSQSKASELTGKANQFRFLFNNSLDGFALCKMIFENNTPVDFIYQDTNPSFEKLTGMKNVIGRKVTDLIPKIKETNPEVFQIYGSVALTGEPQKFTAYINSLSLWLSISVICPEKGYFIAIFSDITNIKKIQENLQNSYNYARSLLEANPDPLVTIDVDGNITDVNLATENATGFSRETLIGTDFSDYFTEPDKAKIGYKKVFAEGTVIDYPLTISHKSCKLIDVLYNANVYRNENGKVIGVVAAARTLQNSGKPKTF
jgi:PAS domain S-box-containing protein